MPKKLQTAKTLLKVYGWILIAIGVVFGLAFSFAGFSSIFDHTSSRDAVTASFVFGGIMGFFFLIICVGWGIFHLAVARAVTNKRHWSKVAAIILAILMLGTFPLGTIFGVFILVGLFDSEADVWFGDKVVTQSTGHDHKA